MAATSSAVVSTLMLEMAHCHRVTAVPAIGIRLFPCRNAASRDGSPLSRLIMRLIEPITLRNYAIDMPLALL
jgi:hypothetical protein